MKARLQALIIATHTPVLILAGLLATASVAALLTFGLKADYRLEAFVATSDRSYEEFRAFMDEFTSNEFALVAIHGVAPLDQRANQLLGDLSNRLQAMPAVQRCNSILDIPAPIRAALGDRLLSHPMLQGNLISADHRTLAILCQMSGESLGGKTRRRAVAEMKRIVADYRAGHPDLEVILTGPYVTLIDMYAYVDQDLMVFSILAFLLTVITLWAVFRRAAPMLFAAGVAAAAVLTTLGLTVAAGIVTSLITQMIVILVIVLAVANCVHLAVARDETAAEMPAAPRLARAARTLDHMMAPCTAVMLTTMVGFGSVCISGIAPVRRFGALMVFGLVYALVLAFAGIVTLHRGQAPPPRRIWMTGLLERTAALAIRRRTALFVIFGLTTAAVAWGITRLQFESDFVKNFRPHSEVRQSYRFIEKNLSPLGSVELIVRNRDGASVLHADLVRRAHDFANQVVRDFPMVKKALTLADPLTLLVDTLPASNLDLDARFALIRALPDGPGLLRNFINDDHDALRLNFRCIEGFNVHHKLAACAEIEQRAAEYFGPGYNVQVTGLYHFYAKLVANLLRDQYRAFGLTVPAVILVIWLLLRSTGLTVVAAIANLLPVVLCLGAMGWANIPVNMTTAMMLSVTLGIAVDDTLQYLWRFRRELAADGDYRAAVHRAHASVGTACVFTTIVITGGFSILMLSQFLPTAYFGGLVGFTMLGALAADLLLLPAMLVTFKPITTGRHTPQRGARL